MKDLLVSDFWWHGPTFLHKTVTRVTIQATDEKIASCTDQERKVALLEVAHDSSDPSPEITSCFTT